MRRLLILTFLLPALPLLAGAQKEQKAPPSPPREFRAAWVATVANIDWPSKKGLTTKQQQAELLAILDKAAKLNFNAVVLQVRPMCDALYASKLEPWSEYLTGKLGQAPKPAWDPLEFAVKEAHARGLELHAWFNPYRARHPSATSKATPNHLTRKRPDLAKPYGKHHWLNPTNKEVQDHSLAVLLDVVKRYDVDGVHMDDYFYPYKEKDAKDHVIPFPDDDTWKVYLKVGGKLSRDDWRRKAVEDFVERLYREVKKLKPHVKVGISPFGIWRPGHPKGIHGFDQYAELYADPKKWFNEGWLDYLSPQLYWPIKQEKQSFPRLLEWWAGENKKGRHLWPGLYTSRVTGKDKGWPAKEIIEQIELTRTQKGATGHVHFSMKAIMNNTGEVADALEKAYRKPALVPASPWLSKKEPGRPTVAFRDVANGRLLRITPAKGESPWRYAVRTRKGATWTVQVKPAAAGGKITDVLFAELPDDTIVTAVDRFGQESRDFRLRE